MLHHRCVFVYSQSPRFDISIENLSLIPRFTHLFITPADGDPLGKFAIIQKDEGEWGLILKEPVDRETKDRYTLKVIATDGKFEAPVTVEVHVLDINDNSPLCEQVSKDMLLHLVSYVFITDHSVKFIYVFGRKPPILKLQYWIESNNKGNVMC